MTAIGARAGRLRLPAWVPGAGGEAAESLGLSAVGTAVQWALASVAGLAVWLVAFAVGVSGLQEQHAQHALYAKFREELANGVAPLGGAVPRGEPVAVFRSDAAGLHDLVAVEGSTSAQLRSGPGHLPGTVLPGQAGVSVFVGRGVSYGAPFGDIASLRTGQTISVTTGQGTFRYRVEDVRRAGDPYPAPLATGAGQLTLVTSEGSGWRSGWAPTHVVYVDALLQGKAVPAPASIGLPSDADHVMAGSTGGLYPLVLWLQLLFIAVVGFVAGRRWWGRWQVWITVTPLVLTALWGASNSFWLLLPNVL